eukprot:14951974-Alexandrium_andersonii.AAC.1
MVSASDAQCDTGPLRRCTLLVGCPLMEASSHAILAEFFGLWEWAVGGGCVFSWLELMLSFFRCGRAEAFF